MKKIKDITVVTGSYTNKNGEEKKRYQNIGSVFEDNGNLKIKLDVMPLSKGGWDGWANCYDPKPYEGKQTKESEDDIPFKRARSLDPATSHAAADQAQDLARRHGGLIVVCLQRFGARGKDGIAELTGLDGHQVARRLPELAKIGLVELTGRVTKSKSGRAEREWRFVPVQQELI